MLHDPDTGVAGRTPGHGLLARSTGSARRRALRLGDRAGWRSDTRKDGGWTCRFSCPSWPFLARLLLWSLRKSES